MELVARTAIQGMVGLEVMGVVVLNGTYSLSKRTQCNVSSKD